MNIIKPNLIFNGSFTLNNNPICIVLHHAGAKTCSIEDIHTWHLANGWLGIGYHYFIRKNGNIYKGRPDNAQGSHCPGYNDKSIGICAEGDFTKETMSDTQKQAIIELIRSLKINKIYGHRELYPTSCPGINYPLVQIKNDINNIQTIQSNSINKPELKLGMNGINVTELQTLLVKKGYDVDGIDGWFGKKTFEALKKYQFDNNLINDGICGNLTWNKLLEKEIISINTLPIINNDSSSNIKLYHVQVGTFTSKENAEKLSAQLKSQGIDNFIVITNK